MRTLLATPLRVDPRTGEITSGLCTSWHSGDARTWTFRCRRARAIADALGRSTSWMFRKARFTAHGDELRARLPFRWLRFPYALTSAAAALPGSRGPFRLVRARGGEVVARRGSLTLDFRRVTPAHAAVLFRRGELDEAPVPLGDIRAAQLDRTLAPSVHVTQLLADDIVVVNPNGALRYFPDTRRAYWQTADRGDYQALVAERQAPAALSLVPGGNPPRAPAKAFRAARARIHLLPAVRVRVGYDVHDPAIAYGASLLVAAWRDLGLGPTVAPNGPDAFLLRVRAEYQQDEALIDALGPFPAVLAARHQRPAMERVDEALFRQARFIPIAWAVDARFVSPRVHGWREDRLGDVDYTRVRIR